MEQVRHESGRRLDLLGHLAPWLTILGTIIFFYVRNPHTFGTTRLLLAVLAVDAFRNILENIYFGLYFGSVYEVLPSQLAAVMGHPVLLILPKFPNVAAGSVVLCLLLWRWLPLAVTERSQAAQRASDLETLASSPASAARNLPSCCRRRPRPQQCNLPSGCAARPAIAHSQQTGRKIAVTISVGIAGASMRTSGIEALMRDADHALYQAKRSGRDQIVVARHDDPTEMHEAAE